MSLDTESRTKTDLWPGFPVGRLLKRLLGCLKLGRIAIRTPSGAIIEHQTGIPGPEATVVLDRWRALRRLLTGGDIGFAEAYMDGDWSSPDLPALLELAAVNIAEIEQAISGLLPIRDRRNPREPRGYGVRCAADRGPRQDRKR